MADATEKRPRTANQIAYTEKVKAEAEAKRRQAPTVNGRQSWLARHGRNRITTMEDAESLNVRGDTSPAGRPHGAAGLVTVEHIADVKVKMWKRGPYGWSPRDVPVSSFKMNRDNGFMEYCPD